MNHLTKQLTTHQNRLLEDLRRWSEDQGSAAAFLEGFSGVGKTRLARVFRDELKATDRTCVLVKIEEGDSVDNFLLNLNQELLENGIKVLNPAFENCALTIQSLALLLKQPLVLIIDEFQRTFSGNQPSGPWLKFLENLANRNQPGRLLFLCNRAVERARWSREHTLLSLPTWSVEDAVSLLGALLEQRGKRDSVPAERDRDLVTALGFNPRAIEILVEGLAWESLEELVSELPEVWTLEDRGLSADLLKKLEIELLQRVLCHLDEDQTKFLYCIAVHRKSVKQEAFKSLEDPNRWSEVRNDLINRFLVSQDKGWYEPHALVREILIHRQDDGLGSLKSAHAMAAAYHSRHFKGGQVVKKPGELGGHFLEAAYHLLRCGKQDQIQELSTLFDQYLQQTISTISPVPTNPVELEYRINFLSALLEHGGRPGWSYHLARCLLKRSQPNDGPRALMHVRLACGPQAPSDSWVLRIRLEAELEGLDVALAVFQDCLKVLAPERDLTSVFKQTAELLTRGDRTEEAIELLKQGIKVIPPTQNLVSLYQASGDLLHGAGRVEEAIELLKQGIKVIPPTQNLFSLYQACGILLQGAGRVEEAIELLKQGIKVIPLQSQAFLYQACSDLLHGAGRVEEAIELLKQGIKLIPPTQSLSNLYMAYAQILAEVDRVPEAVRVLSEGLGRVPENTRFALSHQAFLYLTSSGDESGIHDLMKTPGLGPSQRASGELCLLMLGGNWTSFTERSRQLNGEFQSVWFFAYEAFGHLCLGQPERARLALARFPKDLTLDAFIWLQALIALKEQNLHNTLLHLEVLLKRALLQEERLGQALLLRIWDESFVYVGNGYIHLTFPILPPSLTGLAEAVVHPISRQTVLPDWVKGLAAVPVAAVAVAAELPQAPVPLCFLLLATEWDSGKGGLSTFNRDLCKVLARTGNKVYCLVPQFSPQEQADAEAADVFLLEAAKQPGIDGNARLLLTPEFPVGMGPFLVVGHDHITGPHAMSQAKHPLCKGRIHVSHTIPNEIEWFKSQESGDTTPKTEDKTRKTEDKTQLQAELAKSADLVVGVGPRIRAAIETELSGFLESPQVIQLDPGLSPLQPERKPPPNIQILLLGRAEDAKLKGLDLAAKALGMLRNHTVTLVVRGTPPGSGDKLRQQLKDIANNHHVSILPREYSSKAETIREELRRASLVLMPSQVEGFGLVGLEALAAGTPALVSDQSGLGQVLLEIGGDAAHLVVPVTDNLAKDAVTWEREIDFILRNRSAALAKVREVYQQVAGRLNWDKAVTELLAWAKTR